MATKVKRLAMKAAPKTRAKSAKKTSAKKVAQVKKKALSAPKVAVKKKPATAKKRVAKPAPAKKSVAKAKPAKISARAPAKPHKAAPAKLPTTSARDRGLTVDGYQRQLQTWQKEIVAALRELVKSIEPGIEESIKWGQPVFELYGSFAYLKAFSKYVNFGFWRGSELTDPQGILDGEGGRMRHVKISSTAKMPKDAIERFIREAIYLNREKGDLRPAEV